MGEQQGDTRERILTAAVKVFAAKGFKGATNKEIAREAEITPGLIYWYFADKKDLFAAALAKRYPGLGDDWVVDPTAPPGDVLRRIARQFLSIFRDEQDVLILRMVISEAIRLPEAAESLSTLFSARAILDLHAYLEREAEAGRLRPLNPATATQSFFGMIMAYAMGRFVLEQPHLAAVTPEAYLRDAVDIFVRGLWQSADAAADPSGPAGPLGGP